MGRAVKYIISSLFLLTAVSGGPRDAAADPGGPALKTVAAPGAGAVAIPVPAPAEARDSAAAGAPAVKVALSVYGGAPPEIAAETEWTGIDDSRQTVVILIAVEKGGKDALNGVTLEAEEVPVKGRTYNHGAGKLKRDIRFPSVWIYRPFQEPWVEPHPAPVDFDIVPKYNGQPCGQPLRITVLPVFRYLVTDRVVFTGAGMKTAVKADFDRAWQYVKWKYYIDTDFLDTIAYDAKLTKYRATTRPGITGSRTCALGPDSFSSENLCASVLGHENVHGGQYLTTFIGGVFSEASIEIPAYQWEVDHAGVTGISAGYLQECENGLKYYRKEGPKPKGWN